MIDRVYTPAKDTAKRLHDLANEIGVAVHAAARSGRPRQVCWILITSDGFAEDEYHRGKVSTFQIVEDSAAWVDSDIEVWVRASDGSEMAMDARYLAMATGEYSDEPCYIAFSAGAYDSGTFTIPIEWTETGCVIIASATKTITVAGIGVSVSESESTPVPTDETLTLNAGGGTSTTYGGGGPTITIT